MPRRNFEEFELGHVLGVGTVGTIYEAFDTVNSSRVALKCLSTAVSRDALIEARFAREMVILDKLSHPNIVKYYGGGKHDEQLFFAMELLTGGSLKQAIERSGSFTWLEVATCGVQICSALQYAHNHGIIHRDLKPSNLLFDDTGTLKLVDFGIARDTHEADLTSSGLTVGSQLYMSPEQISGSENITGKTDLYSLGVVMYELMTGRPPFRGENFAQLFQQHLTKPPQPPSQLAPQVPPALDRMIMQLLAKAPDDRPFNARAIQGELLELMNQQVLGESSGADVSASDVVTLGRKALVERLQVPDHNVSWTLLGAIGIGLATFVGAAWYFGN